MSDCLFTFFQTLTKLQVTKINQCSTSDDFGAIVTPLCKIISKDANIVVVQLAAKSLGGIAKGLRKGECVLVYQLEILLYYILYYVEFSDLTDGIAVVKLSVL